MHFDDAITLWSGFGTIAIARRSGFAALLILASALFGATDAAALSDAQIKTVVDAFSNDIVRSGYGIGVGVAVIRPGEPVRTFTYGFADYPLGIPFKDDTLFQIASNTKVFTTNLLGQAVSEHKLSLQNRLGQFSREIGALRPLSEQVTLEDLGSFTAGFPDLAPLCERQAIPGCLPNLRPTAEFYSVGDFLDFFRNTVPKNYTLKSAPPLDELPGPYVYSNFSVGLLGLILASNDMAVGPGDVEGWYKEVKTNLLAPLSMNSTYLNVPETVPSSRLAAGYSPAEASAKVSNGTIAKIEVTHAGANFASAPAVEILGGGGFGAKAAAHIENGVVTSVDVTAGGARYADPPKVILTNGGSKTSANVKAIVANGKIVAFVVEKGGEGYAKAPTVRVEGGRAADGQDAIASARIANGRVTAIVVQDGGAGYFDPLQVALAPGEAETNVIPVWAAAGALTSTLADMARFAEAAMLEPVVNGVDVPPAITQGFVIAEKPRACFGPSPFLPDCPAQSDRVGLAWQIVPADSINKSPEIVTKNGGLTGFSSQIVLARGADLAVVALVNSDDGAPAQNLAFQIAYNLIYSSQ